MSDSKLDEHKIALKSKEYLAHFWTNLKTIFTYEGLIQNAYYLVMVFLLCIVYIANSNKSISVIREINIKSQELKEVNWRYRDIQSRLMYQTSENQMADRSAQLGLKPLEKPAFEIYKEPKVKDTIK